MQNQSLCLILLILNFSTIDFNGSFLPCVINQCCRSFLEPRTIWLGIHWSVVPFIQRMPMVRGIEVEATRRRTPCCYFMSFILLVKRFRLWCSFSPLLIVGITNIACASVSHQRTFVSTWLIGHYSNFCKFSLRKIFCILNDLLWWDIAFSSELLL